MTTKPPSDKPWGGRFSMPTDTFVEKFTQSVSYDQRLCHYDIMGSIAHACMLAKIGVLTEEECSAIVRGLESIEADVNAGKFNWDTTLEDVHMNIESALTQRIGDTGKKLHTGRSRNDQVATDLRLYLRKEATDIQELLTSLISILIDIADRESGTIMPGFTHMQVAQPITFGHHMLAWCEMLFRDRERMAECYNRINIMPLGSAALAGTSYPIDRAYTAKILNFSAVCENSLDAVSDRDFVIEFAHCASLIMMHLSRFSEEIVLWMSQQYAFIELDDAWCTGSSIMPQKKNPDIPELVRGKTGRVYGQLLSLLTLMKAQPLAYNRDNQEDKQAIFDTVDTVKSCLQAYCGLAVTLKVKPENMLSAVNKGFATATDLADYLVRKQVPFRDAHEIVGKAVRFAADQDKDLASLSIDELKQFSDSIDSDVFSALTLEGSVNSRNHVGGTAPEQVKAAVKKAKNKL